jgi:hypothetical protein
MENALAGIAMLRTTLLESQEESQEGGTQQARQQAAREATQEAAKHYRSVIELGQKGDGADGIRVCSLNRALIEP